MSAPDAALEATKLAAVAGQDAMLAELEADDTFAPPLPDDDFFFDDDPLRPAILRAAIGAAAAADVAVAALNDAIEDASSGDDSANDDHDENMNNDGHVIAGGQVNDPDAAGAADVEAFLVKTVEVFCSGFITLIS